MNPITIIRSISLFFFAMGIALCVFSQTTTNCKLLKEWPYNEKIKVRVYGGYAPVNTKKNISPLEEKVVIENDQGCAFVVFLTTTAPSGEFAALHKDRIIIKYQGKRLQPIKAYRSELDKDGIDPWKSLKDGISTQKKEQTSNVQSQTLRVLLPSGFSAGELEIELSPHLIIKADKPLKKVWNRIVDNASKLWLKPLKKEIIRISVSLPKEPKEPNSESERSLKKEVNKSNSTPEAPRSQTEPLTSTKHKVDTPEENHQKTNAHLQKSANADTAIAALSSVISAGINENRERNDTDNSRNEGVPQAGIVKKASAPEGEASDEEVPDPDPIADWSKFQAFYIAGIAALLLILAGYFVFKKGGVGSRSAKRTTNPKPRTASPPLTEVVTPKPSTNKGFTFTVTKSSPTIEFQKPDDMLLAAAVPIDLYKLYKDTCVETVYLFPRVIEETTAFLHQTLDLDSPKEVGGFLLGKPWKDQDKYHLAIRHFIPSTKVISNSLYEWQPDMGELDQALQMYPEEHLVGWLHTHPGHGIFLSRNDLNVHAGSFPQPYQVAIVIDPCSQGWEMGAFSWKNKMEEINNWQDGQRKLRFLG